jgi:hypothetical protein
MKAIVQARNAHGGYSARTENNILLVFVVEGREPLKLGDDIEVDLPNLLSAQQVVRTSDNCVIRIRINEMNIHDLDLPGKHGASRTPSLERLRRTKPPNG